MIDYIKLFDNHGDYETFVKTPDFILPNVSHCIDENEVHYTPNEKRIVAVFRVTNIQNPTVLCHYPDEFSEIEIDGVVQPTVVSQYTFSKTGEHVVKYTLADPTLISDNFVFNNCTDMVNVTIPRTVTVIGSSAFQGCSRLSSVYLPNSVVRIKSYAFSSCVALTSFTVPNSVTYIGASAFSSCGSLSTFIISPSVTSIAGYVFNTCSALKTIISFAKKAPSLNSAAFYRIARNGTLYVPAGSTGYNTWMQNSGDYLGYYGWTKVEQ